MVPPRDDGAPGLTPRTLSGLKWSFLTAGGQAFLSLVVVMILSRLLAPQDFGRLAIALVFLALAETVGRRSIGPALVQRDDLTDRHVATGFTLSLALGVLLAAALVWFAPHAGRLLADPQVAPILETLSLAAILSGLGVVSEHLLRRNLHFRKLMTAAIVSQVIGNGLVATVLALVEFGVWALVWGTLAREAVFTLVVIAYQPPPVRLGIDRREAAELLGTGAGFSAIGLVNVASGHGVHVVIARTLGAASLGLFTRARRLAVVPGRVGPVLGDVLLAAMARRQHRTDRLEAVYLHGLEMVSLAALPASLMTAVSAPEIVAVVLGPQWDDAVPILRMLALTGALQACNALDTSVIRAVGAIYRETGRRAVFTLLLIAGTWLASRWGLAGLAAAVTGARVVLSLLLTQLTLSILGVSWRRLLERYLPALWVCVWATPALWLTARLVRDASLPALGALCLECAAGATAAAAATGLAPPCARPAFPRWALAQMAFGDLGRPGTLPPRRARAPGAPLAAAACPPVVTPRPAGRLPGRCGRDTGGARRGVVALANGNVSPDPRRPPRVTGGGGAPTRHVTTLHERTRVCRAGPDTMLACPPSEAPSGAAHDHAPQAATSTSGRRAPAAATARAMPPQRMSSVRLTSTAACRTRPPRIRGHAGRAAPCRH